MTEPLQHSIDAPPAQSPSASNDIADIVRSSSCAAAALIVQVELPDIARALVATAKAGSVQAIKLCFDLANPRTTAEDLLLLAIRRADPDVQAELLELLAGSELELQAPAE